jgi:hypothetical protein
MAPALPERLERGGAFAADAAPARVQSTARRMRGTGERAVTGRAVRPSMASTIEEPPVDGAVDCATHRHDA